MIQLRHLTKQFGRKTAVDDLSLAIRPGMVTGFLGPNGAGKSTTMRMILGLVKPTSGEVLVNGVPFEKLADPACKVGALIDSGAFDPRYTARQHLELITTAGGTPAHRVASLLRQTGLEQVQHRPIGEFSLGMRQRLGIAAALLGDPQTVILDEPFNGLDVDGIQWLRSLIKELAGRKKAVFVSSHLMSEVEAVADRVAVLAQGRLIADMAISELVRASSSSFVRVRTEDDQALAAAVGEAGGAAQRRPDEGLLVSGLEPEQIGRIAKRSGLAVFELTAVRPSLEDLFVELTAEKAEFKGQKASSGGGGER